MLHTSKTQSLSNMERVPSKKEMRYDRQLRLWGDHGQQKLEEARVCLLNATATGTEILKSLILPGVGCFTIVDGRTVTEDDISCNFFLPHDCVGKPRAQVACDALKELNEEVKGRHVEESVEAIIEFNPTFFNDFDVIIGCDLSDKLALTVGDQCWKRNIPLVPFHCFMLCRCVGLIGYARICVPEHCVIETHPDNPFHDLRLDRPFPTLQKLVDDVDLDALSHQDHSHTPYLILLMKALEQWRQTHKPNETSTSNTSAFPSCYAEKKQIQSILKSMRQPDDKGRVDEENFEEAINSVNRTIRKSEIPPNLTHLFDECAKITFTTDTSPFWFVVSAIQRFTVEHNHGLLPLSGALPDMTADSKKYIQLQHVYQNAALMDSKKVYDLVQESLVSAGLPFDKITFEYVQLCCKHAYQLHCIRGRSLKQEFNEPNVEDMKTMVSAEPIFNWYVGMRARERFLAEKNRYPGTNGIPCPLDTDDLKQRIRKLCQEWTFEPDMVDETSNSDYAGELCRYANSEVHPVSAVLGGVCAHEIIKLLTHQYLPFDNTYIYDGNSQNSAVYKL